MRIVFPEADSEEEAIDLLDELIDNFDDDERNVFDIISTEGLLTPEKLKQLRERISGDREDAAKALEMDG